MRSSLFPDVNVWLALTHDRHEHHTVAADWLQSLRDAGLFFCRFTQLGLLRLLTNERVMAEDVMSQREAWSVYRRWLDDERIEFLHEPENENLERTFQQLSTRSQPSTKLWADAYLAAFAQVSNLTMVTFDQAFRRLGRARTRILMPQ